MDAGTTFSVHLPLVQTVQTAAFDYTATALRAAEGHDDGEPLRREPVIHDDSERWRHEIATTLNQATDVPTTLVDLAMAATDADFGNVQLVGPDGALRIVAHRGFPQPFLEFFRVVGRDDKCSCGTVLARGARLVVPDVRTSPVYAEPARHAMLTADALACQSTPILSRSGEMLGMISTHFRTPHEPTSDQLAMMDLLAQEAAELLAAETPSSDGHSNVPRRS